MRAIGLNPVSVAGGQIDILTWQALGDDAPHSMLATAAHKMIEN
jgi:hypothetical protein